MLPLGELLILRHALGMGDDGRKPAYRNHFVTGEGSKDYAKCLALVDAGHMRRFPPGQLTGGDELFQVTEAGRIAAKPPAPEKTTRSKRRYAAFLDADSGLSFGDWVRRRSYPYG